VLDTFLQSRVQVLADPKLWVTQNVGYFLTAERQNAAQEGLCSAERLDQ